MTTFLKITSPPIYVRCDEIIEIVEATSMHQFPSREGTAVVTPTKLYNVPMPLHEFIENIETMKVELPI